METEMEQRRREARRQRNRKFSEMLRPEFVLVLSAFASMAMGLTWQFEVFSPEPYMDEVFHIPQAQKYCEGRFTEWDPKITTLPGTYILSTTVLRATGFIFSIEEPCSTLRLRSFSLGVSGFNLVLIFLIIGFYSPELSMAKRTLSALNIATFPVLYFFSFLYYTDAVSTAGILLMHFLCLNKCFKSSALAGAFAVLTRQTNIVWVFYHGIFSMISVLPDRYGKGIFNYPDEFRKLMSGDGPQAKKGKRSSKSGKQSASQLPSVSQMCIECGSECSERGYTYVLVGIAFLVFVLYNGSIVVGDKEAHQATINIPQIGYFTLVFGAFTMPFFLCRMKGVLKKILDIPHITLPLAVLMAVIVYHNTPVHPYLLADNRHYTFYVWKRFFENVACFRFLWVPIYIVIWTFILTNMGLEELYLYVYFFCTFLNLVPQLLLEFRYFIPGYLFARMSFKNASWIELILEFFINQSINFVTIYLFFFKTFKWPDSDDEQRFMW